MIQEAESREQNMSDKTGIQWTEATWNPVIGCAKVSAGCKNCYAEKQGYRISRMNPASGYLDVIDQESKRWNGRAKFMPERLDQPLRWQKPRTIFVNSMSDLFHEDVTFEQIAAIFGVMAATPRHTFQVLTKRPQRMREFFEWLSEKANCPETSNVDSLTRCIVEAIRTVDKTIHADRTAWPLPNVHLGVSVEDQQRADERIPLLLECPASLRFLSVEPLIGSVDIGQRVSDIDWVIVGGESGPGARECDVSWIRSVVEQCQGTGVPVFVKQLGKVAALDGKPYRTEHTKGGNPDEWPSGLRVREMPSR